MITRGYLESQSIENAACIQRALAAKHDNFTGESLSIVDNVTLAIEFMTDDHERHGIDIIY